MSVGYHTPSKTQDRFVAPYPDTTQPKAATQVSVPQLAPARGLTIVQPVQNMNRVAGHQEESKSQQLPAELVRARQVKALGTQASAAVLGLGLTAAWFQGFEMPSLARWSVYGLACFICLGAVVLGLAATKDKAQIELHEGRLYIQWGAPSTGPPIAEGAIRVQPFQM